MDLLNTIEHANAIITWQQNLPEKDMPPRWMWHVDHELNEWFDGVKAQYSSGSDGGGSESTMTQNEFARGRRK